VKAHQAYRLALDPTPTQDAAAPFPCRRGSGACHLPGALQAEHREAFRLGTGERVSGCLSATVSSPTQRGFGSFAVEVEHAFPDRHPRTLKRAVGVGVGLRALVRVVEGDR
jgi:hypothetical protein